MPAWCVSRAVVAVGLVVGSKRHAGGFGGGFVAWDGRWYLTIAAHGYGGPPAAGQETSWPFFPLLPALLRGFRELPWPASLAMVLANHLLLALALVGLWHLTNRRLGATAASRAVWVLAVFPMSGVFSMLYPSAIFLAASVWAFELAERRRWGWCGALACAATLVRPNGGLTAAVLVVVALVTGGPERRWRRLLAVGGPSAVAVAAWIAVCAYRTGDPLVFLTAKAAWREHTLVELVRRLGSGADMGQVDVHALLGALSVVALCVAWRWLPRSWRVLALAALALPTVTGLVGLGRYANECFPLAIAGAVVLAAVPRAVRRLAIVSSLLAACVAAASMASYQLLP